MRSHLSLEVRLDEAERSGRFLVPENRSERVSLRRRVASDELAEPFPGVFFRVDTMKKLSPRALGYRKLHTLSALHPDWVFCLFSAALLHGLQVSYAQLGQIHRCVEPGRSVRCGGKAITCHTTRLAAEGSPVLTTVQGARVTNIEQTVLDCLCRSDFRQGLAIADSALHLGFTSKETLMRHFAEFGRGKRGIAQARQTLVHADPGSENGGESFVRAVVLELGFAAPILQMQIDDPMEPGNPKRVDMGWTLGDGRLVLLEVDGKVKYAQKTHGQEKTVTEMVETFSKERLRESHLNLTGATVLRCSIEDARHENRLFKMLATAGVPMAGGGL